MSRARQALFTNPVHILSTHRLDEVMPCLERIEQYVDTGLHAVGFLAYEAAPAFDAALAVNRPADLPLVWFALYDQPQDLPAAPPHPQDFSPGPWEPLITEEAYTHAIQRIRALIAAGDTYQVNYTFPLQASFHGDAFAWFRALYEAQPVDHAACLDTGPLQILSLSPESFFRLDGNTLTTRPMKGTRTRGRWPGEDREQAQALIQSEKERAENVMIVDLLRNDMGRISLPASVHVGQLFTPERYATIWQMTSTISSRTTQSIPQILAALFPCGSVTGAPKVRTMEIIRELEPHPRGAYCGAIGWWQPGRRAQFNVAIRTITVDTAQHTARYHIGSGVTWGSSAQGEYTECLDKAAVLLRQRPEFGLLESMLLDNGYVLLDQHLDRLAASADYFDFPIDLASIRQALLGHAAGAPKGPHKVRLVLSRDGALAIQRQPAAPTKKVRLGFASHPVDANDIFLFHKTTHRAVYDNARASRPDCDDVLLWNQRGEITESATANILLHINGAWLTPPIASGLLAGTMRSHLLAKGEIHETVLTKEDIPRAGAIRLINSVRKYIDVQWVDRDTSESDS